jgi:hypothetical protein
MKQHAAQRTRFEDAAIICDAPSQRLLRSASRSVADPQRKRENRSAPRWETESVAKFQPDSLHTVTPRIVARNPEILVRLLLDEIEATGLGALLPLRGLHAERAVTASLSTVQVCRGERYRKRAHVRPGAPTPAGHSACASRERNPPRIRIRAARSSSVPGLL